MICIDLPYTSARLLRLQCSTRGAGGDTAPIRCDCTRGNIKINEEEEEEEDDSKPIRKQFAAAWWPATNRKRECERG